MVSNSERVSSKIPDDVFYYPCMKIIDQMFWSHRTQVLSIRDDRTHTNINVGILYYIPVQSRISEKGAETFFTDNENSLITLHYT